MRTIISCPSNILELVHVPYLQLIADRNLFSIVKNIKVKTPTDIQDMRTFPIEDIYQL